MPRLLDRGVSIDVITDVDVTTVTGIRFDVQRPDMTTTFWASGSVVISGEGRVRYKFQSGTGANGGTGGNDLGMVGEYVIAPFLDFSETKQFHTPAVRLQVYKVFQP